uniref:FtsJ-like methyltransferase n=1 Tax=Megaviridae environmental sample TaxID=1737588 RepID=A0A5J6VJ90_9VIRU|nr:MAG: FtsJ-like methyltransferase [Megaviridae environmental sample]
MDNAIDLPTQSISSNIDTTISEYMVLPLMRMGFNHYYHKTKDKIPHIDEMSKDSTGKVIKRYRVVNPFEHKLASRKNTSIDFLFHKKYLGEQNVVLNRALYKMWEMIVDYNLIPDNKKPLTSVSLAEGPGSFMQAIMVYRKHMAKSTDKDLYCGITLNDGTVMDSLKMKGGTINCVDNESRMHIFETFPDPTPEQTNGDLTKTHTIRVMKKALQNKTHKYRGAQLITADGGFTWRNENHQEQEAIPLILGEMVTGLNILGKGGNFVIKIFECYTLPTLKLMAIFSSLFNRCVLCKPATSRATNSEKYLIGLNFKGISTAENRKLLALMDKIERNEGFAVDFMSDVILTEEFLVGIRDFNISTANRQYELINRMFKYVDDKNFYGTAYQEYLKLQEQATESWCKSYLV